jgi:hypothetical protein
MRLPESQEKLPDEVMGRIFRISDFMDASKNFIFNFLHRKAAHIVKTIVFIQKI